MSQKLRPGSPFEETGTAGAGVTVRLNRAEVPFAEMSGSATGFPDGFREGRFLRTEIVPPVGDVDREGILPSGHEKGSPLTKGC